VLASAIGRASVAHGEREKRIGTRELVGLVRRIHGGGAGRQGTAIMSRSYDVIIVIGDSSAAALARPMAA